VRLLGGSIGIFTLMFEQFKYNSLIKVYGEEKTTKGLSTQPQKRSRKTISHEKYHVGTCSYEAKKQ